MFTGGFLSKKNRFALLPPQSIAKIAHIKSSIGKRYISISRSKQKQLETNCSRTIHYIRFCCEVLGMDPRLTQLTTSKQTDIAIVYLHQLTSGYTLMGMRIQLSTLKDYMNAMAKWVETHVGRDIRYHPTVAFPDAFMTHWETHPMFKNIYADTKAWQGISNRQGPVTKSMINYLGSLVVGKKSHSLICALINFAVCVCQTGWRGIEWLQPVNPRRSGILRFYEYNNTTSKFENIIYACCIEDFNFKHKCGKRIKDLLLIPIPEVAVYIVCLQFQKNLQHGQEIDFQASPKDPEWCFVRAVLRIITRFKLFCGRPNTLLIM